MPFCPQCLSEYREGFSHCADCDVDLIAKLPAAPPEASPEGWTEIFRGMSAQADVLRASLEAAEIETLSPDTFVSSLGLYAPGSWNQIRIYVRNSDCARAREILSGPHPSPPES